MPRPRVSESGSESSSAVKEKRTRRRTIKCCENCRSSKSSCSKYPDPCRRCLTNQLKCVYLPQDDEGWEVIEKAKEKHHKIDNKIAKRARREEDSEDASEDQSDMEPNPLIITDATYEDDDDYEDNGIRIGRFNLTKRLGSDYRPKMMEEVKQMLDKNDLNRTDHDRRVFDKLPKPHWLDAATGPKVLDPDPDFIAPSLFSHTLQSNQNINKLLQSRNLADRIMEHYWESVHTVACIVHRPSFQRRYDIFWYNVSRGARDTPESTQALVYAALFAGVVSMDAEAVSEELGGDKGVWVKTLENATAISLSRAHVIRTEKPETIQAFVMYLIPMCREIISRTLATLVASAIDLARGMGLNRDGSNYGYDSVVTQVHRMIWHQLCFLDIRVCETQSPRPRIRKDEFDTQFPLNVDDSELENSDLPKESSKNWTGMTLSNARMECNEKIREIIAARQEMRKRDVSESPYIEKMLEMIFEFKQYMKRKYYPMIDDAIPIQHYARLVIALHCRRMHAMVLHEFHMSTPRGTMPERWSQTVIKSGLETMEYAKEIETSEFLRRWRWYAGALQQHQYATLMLMETFAFPSRPYEMRAWESMDWIWQVPSCVPHIHKARWVLEGAYGVMKEYLKARKLRCPTSMDERLGIAPSSPVTSKSPKLRSIDTRPMKKATTARSRGTGISRSGQSRANFQDPELSPWPATSDMGAIPHDMATTVSAQAMSMDGVKYKQEERVHTGGEPQDGGSLASAPYPTKSEQSSSEDESYVSTPHEASPAEPMDSTSSWLTVVNSDSTVDYSGSSTRANVTNPPGGLLIRGAGDGPGDVRENPHARPFDSTQRHTTYHPLHAGHGDTLPLQLPPYIPTGNDDRYHHHNLDSQDGRPRSDSHNNTQIIHEGSYAHIPDYPGGPSGFTPINQYSPLMGFPQQYYISPYVHPEGYGYDGLRDFQESKEQLNM